MDTNNSEALSEFVDDKIDLKDLSIDELKTQAEIFKNTDKIDIQDLSIDELKRQVPNINNNNGKIDIKDLSIQELQRQAAIYKQNNNIASYTYKPTASNSNSNTTTNSNNQNPQYRPSLGDWVSNLLYDAAEEKKENFKNYFNSAEEAYQDGALV